MHGFEEVNAKINRLKREGGVGWSEPGKVLTWDGDTSEQVMLGEIPAVKVHDKCMDLSNVASLTLVPTDPDMSGDYVLTADSFTALLNPDIGIYVLVLNDNIAGGDGETPSIVGVPAKPTGEAAGMGMSEGVYITLLATPMRISKITFAETIHPISDKYLPGPVVIDLDTYECVVGNNNVNLGALVFTLYMEAASKGAVRYDVPDSIAPLWEALSNSTNRQIRVKLSTTALGMPYTVQSDEVTVIYHETAGAVTMSFNFMMYFNNLLSVVKVAMNYGGATTNVFVSVEPITVQSA